MSIKSLCLINFLTENTQIFIYGFCNSNGTAAKTEYGRRFPGRRLPNRKTFIRVFNYLGEHGRFPTVTLNEH